MTSPPFRPETIEKLASAVYPAFAMVAGMQLDVFTPLKDGPMSVEHLAEALAVQPHKLRPLLYALVAAGLLTVQDERSPSRTPVPRYRPPSSIWRRLHPSRSDI